MAKKKAGSSKSAAILKYIAKNRKASAKQVVAALAKQGVDVSDNLVYNVKSRSAAMKKAKPTSKKAARKKKIVARKKRTAPHKATRKKVKRPRVSDLSAHDLVEAKELVKKLGSLESALRAIEVLRQLQ